MTENDRKNIYRSIKEDSLGTSQMTGGLNKHFGSGYCLVEINHNESEELGLPEDACSKEHYIKAHLFVTETGNGKQENRVVGQTLILPQCGDGNVAIYSRSYSLIGGSYEWGPWSKAQQNMPVGHVTSLDGFTSNGIYNGVYTVSGKSPETFLLWVIDNDVAAIANGKVRCISQFKYALNTDSNFSYKTRTGRGDSVIEWGEWVDLGAADTADIQDGAITAQKLSAALLAQIEQSSNGVAKSANGAYWTYGPNAVTLNINKNDGTVGWQTLSAATEENAGVMTAEDKAKLETRYDGIRFIADPQRIPIIDTKSKILDLGADPILLIGDKTFALKNYGNTHRSIYLAHSSGTSATKVLFNVDDHTFKTEMYNYENLSNEVTVCSTRMAYEKIFDVSAPFNYKLVNTGVVEYTGSDVTLIQSYSDYNISAHEDYVTIDPVNTIIDFGKDPILIVKGKSYILKDVCTNWRTLNYKENTASSAVKILYNTNTNLFRSVIYNATLSEGDVVVGAIRHWNPNNVIASFPFEYKIKGELSEENKGQIRCKTGIDFIAHRGVVKDGIPENSLDAYRYAGYCGFKYAETDFCPTKDDELVLMHDASINRTMMNKSDYSAITDTVNVVDKTLQELRDNYVLKSTDVRFRREIPTLEEFFMTCKRCGVFPIAEIKTSGTTQAHVLKAYELGKSILGDGNFGFTSFSNELLDYARSLSEKTPLWYISTPIVGTVNSITNKSRESEATIWYPEYTALSEDNVKTHRNAGIKVSCWVVPVSEFDRVLKLGVDEMAGDSLSPDINGLVGTVVKTSGSFADLTTDGSVANNILTLTSGQSALVRLNSGWIGGYYISIVASGNFKVTAPNLATTIVSDTPDRFIFQGLSTGISTFKIEAVESTQVEFVEIGSVEF